MYDYNYGNLPESFIGTWIRNNEYHNLDRELRNANDLKIQPVNFFYFLNIHLLTFLKFGMVSAMILRPRFPRELLKQNLKALFFKTCLHLFLN